MSAASGLESYFGNILAKKEKEIMNRSFAVIEWVVHFVSSVIFSIVAVTLIPFIKIYTYGFTDANYVEPVFGVLMTLSFYAMCLRVPYFRVIKAAGHFKETQIGAFISTGINVVVSLVLVFRFGLMGVAIGMLSAMLFHTCYFVFYLSKNILSRSSLIFVRYLICDALIFALNFIVTGCFSLGSISYISWFWLAVKVGVVAVVIAVAVNLFVNFNICKGILKYLRGMVVRK